MTAFLSSFEEYMSMKRHTAWSTYARKGLARNAPVRVCRTVYCVLQPLPEACPYDMSRTCSPMYTFLKHWKKYVMASSSRCLDTSLYLYTHTHTHVYTHAYARTLRAYPNTNGGQVVNLCMCLCVSVCVCVPTFVPAVPHPLQV